MLGLHYNFYGELTKLILKYVRNGLYYSLTGLLEAAPAFAQLSRQITDTGLAGC